jgi:hypothetical protein
VVGPLGFEPRIANAPGWYTEPLKVTVDQYTILSPSLAIRRPQPEARYQEQIDKTIAKATIEGKAKNTIKSFRHRLRELSRFADLMNPEDVKKTIGYSKLSNSSKCSFALAYEWFTKANELKWEKPRFKWNLSTPIIPTTDQVNKIISATTERFATIFKLMTETGAEGEELHQTHRNQFETTQGIISIKGLKGHGSANYKLKQPTGEMLREYLIKNPQDYPFPRPYVMSTMWRRARDTASKNHNDPSLKAIPMKNLRNYSGAQFWYSFPDPIGVMRHLRHKRMETTMHYLRAITLDGDIQYDCKAAKTPEEITKLIELGYTLADTINDIHLYRKRK